MTALGVGMEPLALLVLRILLAIHISSLAPPHYVAVLAEYSYGASDLHCHFNYLSGALTDTRLRNSRSQGLVVSRPSPRSSTPHSEDSGCVNCNIIKASVCVCVFEGLSLTGRVVLVETHV